jgi:Ca-activated chloride channel family protein
VTEVFASLRFEDPWVLSLLALVVVGIALNLVRGRRPAAGILFSSVGLLPAMPASWRIRMRWVLVALRVAALVLFVVALARPQIVHASVESVSEGIDIVLSIDTSGSMSEAGFGGTTKIDAVKRVVDRFLGTLKNDRVGIVVFSGEAVVLGPPTLDYAASQKLVAPIDTGTLAGGTAIGTGLATAINVIRDSDATSKVVILLTDGENNSGDISPLDASNMAKLLGVKVYTIGAVTATAGPDKDVSSDTIDAQLMKKMAEDTGGHYYSVSDEGSLADVYREIESLEKSKVGTREFTDYQEAHLGFLALGAVLLFVEIALAATLFRRTP